MKSQIKTAIEMVQISLNHEILWDCDLIVFPIMPYNHLRLNSIFHIQSAREWRVLPTTKQKPDFRRIMLRKR
jgi:hypothetical protein